MQLLPEPCVTTVLASLDRDAVDFLETGHTALHLLETRAPQIPHAFLGSLRANLRRAPQGENDAHDRLRDRQHLINAHPALVAVRAVGTSLGREDLHSGGEIGLGEALLEQGFPRDLQQLLAVTAQPPRQALRNDETHRGGDGVGLDPHVDDAGEGLRRIVRVQRGQHQVAGLRRLDGDLGRLEVADLAHHDDVRVLAEEGAHGRGESQPDLVSDVDLVDAGEVDFRGILGGGDIRVLAVEDRETGIERHRLAAARRPGHEDHALRFRQVLEVELLLEGLVAERFDAELGLRGIENTQHELLAEERRAGAHAEVDGAVLRELHLDAPVLGHTPLGDVEARHDLEARGQLGGEDHRRLGDLLQHPVHAKAHAVELLKGLEVNVRCAAADRVQHDLVDEAHDRGVFDVVAPDLVVELLLTAGDLERLEIDVPRVGERAHLVVDLLNRLVDSLLQLVVLDDDGFYGETRLELDLVNGVLVRRVRHREKEPLAAAEDWQDAVLGEELVAHQPYAIEVERHRIKVEQGYAELVGGGHRDIPGIGDAARHELRDDAGLTLAGGAQGFQHRRLLDHAVLYQPLRQAAEPRTGSAAERQRYVVIHGLGVVDLGLKVIQFTPGGPGRNCQILADSERGSDLFGGVWVTLRARAEKKSPGTRPGLCDTEGILRSRSLARGRSVLGRDTTRGKGNTRKALRCRRRDAH